MNGKTFSDFGLFIYGFLLARFYNVFFIYAMAFTFFKLLVDHHFFVFFHNDYEGLLLFSSMSFFFMSKLLLNESSRPE